MHTFLPYFKKEHMAMTRTYKLLILGFIALFFALSGPIILYFTPKILAAQFEGSYDFANLMTNTLYTSFLGYMEDMYQILYVVVLFFALGMFNNERLTRQYVLPKMAGASETGMYLGKIAYLTLSVLLLTILTSLVNYGYSYMLFDHDLSVMGAMKIVIGFVSYLILNISLIGLFAAFSIKKFFSIFITLIHYFAVPALMGLFKMKYSPYHLIRQGNTDETFILSLLVTLVVTGLLIVLTSYQLKHKH